MKGWEGVAAALGGVVGVGVAAGSLTSWWIGLLAGISIIATPPGLYSLYLRWRQKSRTCQRSP